MRLSALLLAVSVSACLAGRAAASTRPHYGGTLRVVTRDAPLSLDPADTSLNSFATRSLSRLIFDTLVTLDDRGRPQAALASSWKAEPGNRRWQFSIRSGVTFQDGSVVSADAVAASLRSANPSWKVFANGEVVTIECDVRAANLPAILAFTRNAVVKRSGGKLTGSGAFVVGTWDPGKKLVLTARDDYWGGRAFLDGVEVEMGKSFREQTILLDLGKADVAELAADQTHRSAGEGLRVENSGPNELMALVFSHDPSATDSRSAENGKLRQALALSIDRESMNSVLLQGGGEPSGALLPGWLTGYAFLFPAGGDMRRAQLIRGEVPQAPAWTVGYDAADPLARVIAERIALNASDAGLRLQPVNSANPDLRLVRVALDSTDPRLALVDLMTHLGMTQPAISDDSAESLYVAENTVLQSRRVIPLLYLRSSVALSAKVKGWTNSRDGGWALANIWLGTEKP
jgi:peptide/nickel transport system substrate-binding protein